MPVINVVQQLRQGHRDRTTQGAIYFRSMSTQMGSTALSLNLANAVHEYNMEDVPSIMCQKIKPDFDDFRQKWLGQRRLSLGSKIDICTSTLMLTAEISDQVLEADGYKRMPLNRPL